MLMELINHAAGVISLPSPLVGNAKRPLSSREGMSKLWLWTGLGLKICFCNGRGMVAVEEIGDIGIGGRDASKNADTSRVGSLESEPVSMGTILPPLMRCDILNGRLD